MYTTISAMDFENAIPKLNINISVDLSVVAEPGAGMHFIGSHFNPAARSGLNNEYILCRNYYFNKIDSQFRKTLYYRRQCLYTTGDLEQLQNVMQVIHHDKDVHFSLMASHAPPFLLSNIVNLNINEQLAINNTKNTDWFIRLLGFIKQECSADYTDGTLYRVAQIMNLCFEHADQLMQENKSLKEYKSFLNKFCLAKPFIDIFYDFGNDRVVDAGSILSFRYYFHCKHYNIEPSYNSLLDYCTLLVNNLDYSEDRDLDIPIEKRQWHYYLNKCNYLIKHSESISYEDFYFKLKMPIAPTFKKIDPALVKIYSLENISLVRKFVRYLNNPLNKEINLKLDQYSECLLAA